MEVIESMNKYSFEQIVFCNDNKTGLKGIIAIHNTTLGPAMGGTRIAPYKSEEEALADVMRLSRAMTYKNAVAGLYYGGGKGVIIADPKKDKSEALMRAYGRFINSLGGRYIAGEDVGSTEEDMLAIRRETPFVIGLPKVYGGSGNVSEPTAYGIWKGIKASSAHVFGDPSLKGKRIAIQGVGNVGSSLCHYLKQEGAEIFISDVDENKVGMVAAQTGAKPVVNEEIHRLEVDVFSPCALGGILHDQTIPQLKCRIVAGAANNPLVHEEEHAQMLADRGIVYVVDYVINAGGVMCASNELIGYNPKRVYFEVDNIYNKVTEMLKIARDKNVTTAKAAMMMANRRFQDENNIPRLAYSFKPPMFSSPGPRINSEE
ncbi:leucine dehydrogenase [Candidatus Formimonas warabiya]|uniref:Leucine dehydrogenase n=2 Tax=Formimonas warabiya TaxID=1761012 RepID=A0A3G1KVG3_FORW1|nr:leucine dehydrogenase [Candidatus Formimonas warabiya]